MPDAIPFSAVVLMLIAAVSLGAMFAFVRLAVNSIYSA